jgi:hypothetical protein
LKSISIARRRFQAIQANIKAAITHILVLRNVTAKFSAA